MFNSADSIPTSELSGEDDPMLNYPVEYLNEINCTGMPLAKLEVKIGCPVLPCWHTSRIISLPISCAMECSSQGSHSSLRSNFIKGSAFSCSTSYGLSSLMPSLPSY